MRGQAQDGTQRRAPCASDCDGPGFAVCSPEVHRPPSLRQGQRKYSLTRVRSVTPLTAESLRTPFPSSSPPPSYRCSSAAARSFLPSSPKGPPCFAIISISLFLFLCAVQKNTTENERKGDGEIERIRWRGVVNAKWSSHAIQKSCQIAFSAIRYAYMNLIALQRA